MCDCVTEIQKRALADMQEKKRYKKQVVNVRMKGVVFPIIENKMSARTRTSSELEVELEGQKKRQKVSMFHNYCPFCGEKYDAA